MKLYRFEDASQFYDRMKDYLVNHEALHNVMLGLCNALIYNPERFHEKPYLADVEIDGDIAAVAMRIPPKGLMLSQVKDLRAVEAIAQNLHLTQKLLPGVNAPTASAKAFAEVWYSLTSQSYQIKMALRAFQLEQVQPISDALGDLRRAQSGDRQLLMHWYAAFSQEALGSVESVERVVDRHLQQGTAYLWENETPVSMASRVGITPNGARVGLVYTPPEHRRKGYGNSCVGALSQTLLNQGYPYCFLFTDQANPTSNHIYQAIGYQAVGDLHEYSFVSRYYPKPIQQIIVGR